MRVFRVPTKRLFGPPFVVAGLVCVSLMSGCGGGSESDAFSNLPPGAQVPNPGPNPNPNPGQGNRGTISGTLYAPDGVTPLAFATVQAIVSQLSTQTDANGAFTLTGLPEGDVRIRFSKGQFSLERVVNVRAGQTTQLSKAETTIPSTGAGAARIAVITGDFDKIENVLAKLGLGSVDGGGQLVFGTEKFDLYNGGGDAPQNAPAAATLLNDPARLAQYDIVFINCGADESPLDSDAVKNNLRNYVNNGGNMFATDYAYDYVEQIFPAAADFYGSDNVPAGQPEERDAAQVGSGESPNATVLNAGLRNFLSARNLLSGNGTFTAQDNYVVINGVSATTQVYLTGALDNPSRSRTGGAILPHKHHGQGVDTLTRAAAGRALTEQPLTLVFPSGNGKVLYSTYHTTGASSGPQLTAQEQVLAYLVFEL